MFVLYIGWTLLTLSHMAWAAELSDDYNVPGHGTPHLNGWLRGLATRRMALAHGAGAWRWRMAQCTTPARHARALVTAAGVVRALW